MSVYIKGMEMPKSCDKCPLIPHCSYCEGYDDHCPFEPDGIETEWDFRMGKIPKEIPDWCPLVPVQPHGDLIDRTSLLMDIIHSCVFSGKNGARAEIAGAQKVRNRISAAPIVVPADGGAENE